jgi:predicted enzyme related to lactoylglutathione lyase
MTVLRTEIGLVSADDTLVAFYSSVFGLDVLEPRVLPTGTVHRLGNGEALLKVMVPSEEPVPAPARVERFWESAGLRYFTLWVRDLDGIAARCAERGGTVSLGPIDLRPGVRTMVVHDPDGNAIEVMEATAP